MKILVVRNSYIIAGAEIYYLKLQHSLRKLNIDCQIILLTNNNDLAKIATSHNIESYVLNTFSEEVGTKKGLLRLFFNLPDYIYKYISIIHKLKRLHKIDLVLLSGKTEKYILTLLKAVIDLPIFWIEHGQVFTPTMSKIALFLYKFSSNYCTYILSESNDTMNDLIDNGINPKIIKYIGSGIDHDYFVKTKHNFSKRLIVGFMATICWEKGVEELTDTLKRVIQVDSTIKFLILGDGPQLSFLKEFIIKNRLSSRVIAYGRTENVKAQLNRMDILLSPIHHPGGLSLSVQEAMAMGCIPIVTDVGGNRELVNSSHGYIHKSDFSINACLNIIELKENINLRKRLSQNARKYVIKNYSAIQFTKKLYSFLRKHID